MTRSAARLCLVACLFLLAPAAGAQPAADTAEPAVEAPPGTTPVDPAPDTAAQREREAQHPGAAAAAESETGLAGPTLHATLRNAEGAAVGEATLRETPNGVLVRVSLRNLPPGEHAFHVHETGRCEPPFESAGAHLAGAGDFHGFAVTGGPHAGDLPNLMVPSDGRLEAEAFAPKLTFAQIEDADGAAVVVHARPDDHRSQPSGDAGDRIACGVIEKSGQE